MPLASSSVWPPGPPRIGVGVACFDTREGALSFGLLGKGPSSVSQFDKVTPTKSSRNLDNKLSSS